MIKKIRYKVLNSLFNNKELLKGMALMLYSYHCNESNVISNYNANKLSQKIKVSHKTITQRIKVLQKYNLCHIQKNNLIFNSIVSKHKDRNISIDKINYSSLKDVEKSLYGILLVVIQSRKDFCKGTIRRATKGRSYKEVKSARLMLRKCRYGDEYKEYGLSYRKIAIYFGVSLKSAFTYVQYAIKQGMVKLKRNFQSFFIPNVNKREIFGFTFTTKNYGYIIKANTYTINS